MKYTINREKNKPAYLQLYIQIKEDIVKGIYPYESKLPSKRYISEETNLSVVTVEHAYSILCDEGYVEARERSGYFVIFKENDGFLGTADGADLRFEGFRHKTATEAQFPFSVLAKTMRSVISEYGEGILERSRNSGTAELRDAIKKYLARSRGITAEENQIIIGSGSEYLYSIIVELLGYEKLYAIESPSYKKIEQVYTACNIKYEKLPLIKDGIKSSALQQSKADVLHISPYRSFPSSVTASASKKHEYIRWATEKGSVIIEDDFESEFTISKKSEETLFSLAPENVIYMNTFSKTISPSLRVGYAVLPKALAEKYEKKLGFYSCTVPTYIQYVLASLLNNGDFERHINRVRRQKRKEQKV